MTRERMLQIADLVIRASEIPRVRASITIGDATDRYVYLHDMREHDCTAFLTIGLNETEDGVSYILDPNFDAAEARLKQLLMKGENDA